MRVLIIGGTSFIGPHVVRNLISDGHELTVFHRGKHEPELPDSVRHLHSSSAVPDSRASHGSIKSNA